MKIRRALITGRTLPCQKNVSAHMLAICDFSATIIGSQTAYRRTNTFCWLGRGKRIIETEKLKRQQSRRRGKIKVES